MPAFSLQDRLDTITARTRTMVQPERLAPGEQAVAELFASGIEERILPVGAKAPEFELPDGSGRTVRSRDLLALGPVILNFFRGRWCSYCVNELETWRDLYDELRAHRALLVGISPQTVRQNDFACTQHSLPFPVLADEGAALAEQFGLVYTVPDYLQRYYRSIRVTGCRCPQPMCWRRTAQYSSRAPMRIFVSAPSRRKPSESSRNNAPLFFAYANRRAQVTEVPVDAV
jgi:peroxiredoxin